MICSKTELIVKIGGIVREMTPDELFADRIELGEWSNTEDILPDKLYVPNGWGSWSTVHGVFIRAVRSGELLIELEINNRLRIAISGDSPVLVTNRACTFVGYKPAEACKLGDFVPVAKRTCSPGLPGDKLNDFFQAKQIYWVSKIVVPEAGRKGRPGNTGKANPELFLKIRRIIMGEFTTRLTSLRLEGTDKYQISKGFLVLA